VVGGDATWEEISIDKDSRDGSGICFYRVGDKDSPYREKLTELERVLAAREVELNLYRKKVSIRRRCL
jgi:hypothetical protein